MAKNRCVLAARASEKNYKTPQKMRPKRRGDQLRDNTVGRVSNCRFTLGGAAGSLALGDPDQPVAGDDGGLVGFRDITEADELGEMSRGNVGLGSMHRGLDQRGELLRSQKV